MLPQILRITHMIRVYMEWNPEQHPSIYYVLNTHHLRCYSDMVTLMLSTTETSYLNRTAAYDESKTYIHQIWSTEYRSIQGIHPLFIFFGDQVIYFVDMAISRYDLGKSWPRSQARSMAKVIYETNRPIHLHYFCFVQIGPCIFRTSAIYHLTLKFRGQGQCRIQGNIFS